MKSTFRGSLMLAFAFALALVSAQEDTSGNDIARDLLRQRALQDVDTVIIGSDSQTITVTIDQTTLNGAATYGDKIVSIRPAVSGSDSRVTCTATMNANGVDMRFFLRKYFQPDKDSNGNAKDYDCEANSDVDFIAPDTESCSVTSFPDVGVDYVFGYVAVLDNALNMGATYTINFVCDLYVPNNSPSFACFSPDSTVDVLGKGSTTMKDLAVGDKVLVGDGSYEPVYSFAHRDQTLATKFLQVHTQGNHEAPLELTAEHLVLANDKYVPAKALKIGDVLTGANSGEMHTITKIHSITKNGIYAPLTSSGNLVVDGVKASAYVSLQGDRNKSSSAGNVIIGDSMDTGISYHFISHIALSPIRMACVGISPTICSSTPNGEGGNSGYAPFVSFWFDLVDLFESQSSKMVQVLLLVALFAGIAPLYAMESIFGAVLAPAVIAGLVAFMALKGEAKKDTVKKAKLY